jgi:hypothetical protein
VSGVSDTARERAARPLDLAQAERWTEVHYWVGSITDPMKEHSEDCPGCVIAALLAEREALRERVAAAEKHVEAAEATIADQHGQMVEFIEEAESASAVRVAVEEREAALAEERIAALEAAIRQIADHISEEHPEADWSDRLAPYETQTLAWIKRRIAAVAGVPVAEEEPK